MEGLHLPADCKGSSGVRRGMRTFDALWIAYRAETTPTWVYQYKALINGLTYTEAEIWGFSKTGSLAPDSFGIGNCPIQQLTLSVTAKTEITIPRNAQAEIQVQITGATGTTLWHSLGVFFIEARKTLAGGKLEFECLDRMAFTDVPFLTDGENTANYPMLMSIAMTRIYTRLGTTLDARCTVSSTMAIEYPNDLTMRQVMAFIALAHGGNFCITEADKLRLVIPGYSGSPLAVITGSNAMKTYIGNGAITWDSLAMIYTEAGAYYESGTTFLAELEVTMPWATQAMCNAVHAILNGYTYSPYAADQADLDPAIELGDYITIDGVPCNVWSWTWNNRLYCDIRVPSYSDTSISEFGYTGTLAAAISRKVTLGASYFGTVISRAEGLKISRSDGTSEVILNSLTMAMRALKEGTMVDKLYFDPVRGIFVFDGEVMVGAQTLAATLAGITASVAAVSGGGSNFILNSAWGTYSAPSDYWWYLGLVWQLLEKRIDSWTEFEANIATWTAFEAYTW